MGKLFFLTAMLLLAACGKGESIEEFNRKQAEVADLKKPKGKAVKVETALPGGAKVGCDKLLDVQRLTELLQEKQPVTVEDQTKQEVEPTALCSVRRGGEVVSEKQQAEILKKKTTLGVLAGDELCSIAAYCSIPADENQLKEECKRDIEKGGTKGNEEIGVFACIKITPKGPYDAFTYRYVDPDSRCVLRVRGGPSVNDEAQVQACAKAALELVGPASIQ